MFNTFYNTARIAYRPSVYFGANHIPNKIRPLSQIPAHITPSFHPLQQSRHSSTIHAVIISGSIITASGCISDDEGLKMLGMILISAGIGVKIGHKISDVLFKEPDSDKQT